MRPQVGKQVTVVCKNYGHPPVFVPLWNDWTLASPETNTYVGTVVKSDYWMKVDEFNLTTGQRNYPIRTISLKNVISIDGVNVAQQPTDKVEMKTIKGSKGNEYIVTVTNGVAEHCTCPGFKYHGGQCKHLSLTS
jgi:hypothetical protein